MISNNHITATTTVRKDPKIPKIRNMAPFYVCSSTTKLTIDYASPKHKDPTGSTVPCMISKIQSLRLGLNQANIRTSALFLVTCHVNGEAPVLSSRTVAPFAIF